MKKVSLLAASVAFALVGCGGGSDSNNDNGNGGGTNPPAPGGVVITGFDGYFKNAAVFVDQDNDGVWDMASEQLLGMTNEKGQVTLTEKPSGIIALQTLTPGGKIQSAFINKYPQHAGTYTVDMDHAGQAMAHEVVFRAPNSSDVISPITDLVTLEMKNGKTAEEAEAAVNLALGGTEEDPIDLYSDFVTGTDANPELHKTAQILTESKAANPESYDKKATEFAKEADTLVDNMTDEAIKDVNNKPVIEDTTPDADNLAPEVITNSKLIVDATVKEAAVKALPTLKEDDNFSGVEIVIADLFVDADQEAGVTPSLKSNLEGTGITASINGGKLVLTPANPVKKPGNYTLTLTASDYDSKGDKLETTASTEFNITIEALNKAPVVVEAEKAKLQAEISKWDLRAGEPFNRSINVSALFEDKDGSVVTYWGTEITVDGLSIPDVDQPEQTIEGTPTKAYAAGETFHIVVADDQGATAHTSFTLPEVKEAYVPEDKHPLEGKTWYYLENGSSDGDGNHLNDYDRVWCESIKFENGQILGTDRTLANRTTCTEPTANWGTYQIIDGKIVTNEDMSYALDTTLDASKIAANAQFIMFNEEGMDYLYTYFSNKTDAEARINVQSNAIADERAFPMYLPDANEDLVWHLGMASMALTEENPGEFNAYINFDLEGQNFSCENLNSFYQSFMFTGDDLGMYGHQTGGSCQTQVENDIQFATVSFNLSSVSNLEKGKVYSIIGSTADGKGKYMENVRFSVEWTGKGDNE
ncbi:hypothetical protein JCM19237_1232 [Photobacterium aphoticum]|uniref:Acid phosphatase n=1 Tax=Photobacterium aphoticum TaxID=754436 RepID=A0A090QN51_9GAMM|nr:hypothetical protein JCM19237_1232 [Photobacterium aphoticum]